MKTRWIVLIIIFVCLVVFIVISSMLFNDDYCEQDSDCLLVCEGRYCSCQYDKAVNGRGAAWTEFRSKFSFFEVQTSCMIPTSIQEAVCVENQCVINWMPNCPRICAETDQFYGEEKARYMESFAEEFNITVDEVVELCECD